MCPDLGLLQSPVLYVHIWEFPKFKGTLFGGPYNKDPTIWVTILGSPIFRKPSYKGILRVDMGFAKSVGGSNCFLVIAHFCRVLQGLMLPADWCRGAAGFKVSGSIISSQKKLSTKHSYMSGL